PTQRSAYRRSSPYGLGGSGFGAGSGSRGSILTGPSSARSLRIIAASMEGPSLAPFVAASPSQHPSRPHKRVARRESRNSFSGYRAFDAAFKFFPIPVVFDTAELNLRVRE